MASPQSKVGFLPTVTPAEVELPYVVTIGGVNVTPLLASFRISETLDAPVTLLADIDSTAAPYFRPTVGQLVFATEAGVRIFGGSVTGIRERGLTGPSEQIRVEIQASSFELNAARRVITTAISAEAPVTIGAAFGALVAGWYGELGVTLHPAQVAGPIVPAVSFARERGDTVNRQIAGSVGFLQSIDFDNRLRAWEPGEIAAPVNYDEAVNADLLTGDLEVERQLQNGYANRIVLSGDKAQTDDTDRWIGDGVTQLFPLSRTPVSWWVVVLNETNTYETVGTPPAMWIIDPAAKTIRREDFMGPPPVGTIIDFRYIGIFDPQAAAEDAAEIATYGLWEFAETISSVSGGSAADYAAVLLARKIASKDEIVTMRTRQPGFRAGQLMNVVAPSRGVAGDFLITQVDTGSESGGKRLVRSMTLARSQTNDHDWRRIYVQWAGGAIGESSGGGSTVMLPPPVDPGAGSQLHGASHGMSQIDPIPNLAFRNVNNAFTVKQTMNALEVQASHFFVGTHVVNVTGDVTLPQAVGGGGGDVYLNVANVFTQTNTFPGLTVKDASADAFVQGWCPGVLVQMAGAAGIQLRNATNDVECGLFSYTDRSYIGTWTNHIFSLRTNNIDRMMIAAGGNVGIGNTNPLRWLHVGDTAETPVQGYPGIIAQASNNAAQVSAKYATGGGAGVEGGMFAHPNGMYFGSWTNHSLLFRVNNADKLRLDADGSLNCYGPINNAGNYVYGYRFYNGASNISIGGFIVTVTADCSIPGAGGGVTLPPNLAYNNINNNWSAYQSFGGLSFNGHDLDTWLNQSVRTDASPTFASLTVTGATKWGMTVGSGGFYSAGQIETGNAYWAGGQQGVSVQYIVQTSGPDRTLKFVGGICTQFA